MLRMHMHAQVRFPMHTDGHDVRKLASSGADLLAGRVRPLIGKTGGNVAPFLFSGFKLVGVL